MNNDKTKGRFLSGRNLSSLIDSRSRPRGRRRASKVAEQRRGGMNNGRSAAAVFPALAELLALCGI